LDEQGIDYEVVNGPSRPGKRVDLQRLSGQRLYPVIEFENGSIYRDESKDMAAHQTKVPRPAATTRPPSVEIIASAQAMRLPARSGVLQGRG